MATLADFRARFTEFAAIDDTVVQLNIDDATLEVSANFGTFQDAAILFLAAHYLTLSQDAASGQVGTVGAVASESVDGVSQSFVTASAKNANDQLLSATVYGQRFLAYRDKVSVGNVRVV